MEIKLKNFILEKKIKGKDLSIRLGQGQDVVWLNAEVEAIEKIFLLK